jgi:hypothetical protein
MKLSYLSPYFLIVEPSDMYEFVPPYLNAGHRILIQAAPPPCLILQAQRSRWTSEFGKHYEHILVIYYQNILLSRHYLNISCLLLTDIEEVLYHKGTGPQLNVEQCTAP